MKVGFISLGCSKNLVDTEICIGLFKEHKYDITNKPDNAEILIINTCGFIDSAKQEAISTIFEMAKYKKSGTCKYLIVMGCLVKRYKNELEKLMPEVDLFLSIDEYNDIWEKITNLIGKDTEKAWLDYKKRVITTGNYTAYLKIAEGCSNNCTYCAIPMIRGPFVSRKMEDIIEEAKELKQKGIKEIIVIAQDTTKYGVDIYGESKLSNLLEELSKLNFTWIRFLYSYPESITKELIQIVREHANIVPYFDIPIQHISDRVLKRMNRRTTGEDIKNKIAEIRNALPNAIIRTSLIVGFPGETEEDFDKLYKFVEEIKFDKLGVFKYSKEEGTPASRLKQQIHWKTKEARRNRIMKKQQEISRKKLEEKIGNIYDALVVDITKQYIISRTYMDVPDMDGLLYIKKENQNTKVGDFVKCKITEISDYDLVGEMCH